MKKKIVDAEGFRTSKIRGKRQRLYSLRQARNYIDQGKVNVYY